MVTRKSISPRVIEYMHKNPNQHVHVHTIAKDLGDTVTRVAGSLSHLATRRPELGLIAISRGVYMFQPGGDENKSNEDRGKLYSFVGKAKDGSLVLESEDGTLLRAVEL